jgi:hypothetical protein
VAQAAAFAAEQRFTPPPKLLYALFAKGIQGPGQIGLTGKVGASPGLRQGQVGPETRVDLINRPTPSQDTDQHIQQFVIPRMVNLLER